MFSSSQRATVYKQWVYLPVQTKEKTKKTKTKKKIQIKICRLCSLQKIKLGETRGGSNIFLFDHQ